MKTLIVASIAAALAAIGSYHLRSIYYATYHVPVRHISSADAIPDSLAESVAVKITNPHSHVPIHDTRNVTVSVSKTLSDEEILARFVKGFFGGYVFRLERGALRANKKEVTHFEVLEHTPASSPIWSKDELSLHKLPPLHTLLFGAFRIVDVHLEQQIDQQASPQGQSYIDFAFGSDDGFIAGVHRFSVSRSESTGKEEDAVNVTVEFAHAGCNPKEDKPLKPDFIQTLHLWYAMLLFREGVSAVIKA